MKLSTIGCVAGVPRPKPVAQECVGSQLPAEPPGKTARKRWEPPPARQYQAGRLARLPLPAERRGQQLAGPGIAGSIDVLSRFSSALMTVLGNCGPLCGSLQYMGRLPRGQTRRRPPYRLIGQKYVRCPKTHMCMLWLPVSRFPASSVTSAEYAIATRLVALKTSRTVKAFGSMANTTGTCAATEK